MSAYIICSKLVLINIRKRLKNTVFVSNVICIIMSNSKQFQSIFNDIINVSSFNSGGLMGCSLEISKSPRTVKLQ
jgi:hypothetical protein